jgi:protein TonB
MISRTSLCSVLIAILVHATAFIIVGRIAATSAIPTNYAGPPVIKIVSISDEEQWAEPVDQRDKVLPATTVLPPRYVQQSNVSRPVMKASVAPAATLEEVERREIVALSNVSQAPVNILVHQSSAVAPKSCRVSGIAPGSTPPNGESFIQAKYWSAPKPFYPKAARKKHQEGLVTLTVSVDCAGLPSGIDITTSSGYRLLDDAAISSVKEWRFTPARAGTNAVSSQVQIPIRFALFDRGT